MTASKNTTDRLGQVVAASTTGFTAHCHELYQAPPLGSLVRCGRDGSVTYAVVANVATESLDPGRRPVARDADAASEDEVYANHPQITRLLATRFEAIAIGHRDSTGLHRYLSPLPPPIYAFVHLCDGDETREFTESLDALPVLLNAPNAATDDVAAAFLRLASATHPDPRAFLVGAGKELAAHLIPDRSGRLNGILRRLSR